MSSTLAVSHYKKAAHVFWVLVGNDLLIRNYETNVALQLSGFQRRAWELLDGAHTIAEVGERLKVSDCSPPQSELESFVASLEATGFLVHAE